MAPSSGKTFLGSPQVDVQSVEEASVAIFGAPHGTPYEAGKVSHCADAPSVIRGAGQSDAARRDHYDFDSDGLLCGGSNLQLVDCGDVPGAPDTSEKNRELIAHCTSTLLGRGAVPVLLGGDDSVPIPFVSAFSSAGPIWVVQVDAHLDWRDERDGEKFGWSSPMRRMSEMAHVEGIVQVGLRGVGTARLEEVEAAREWGAMLVPARDVHNGSVDDIVRNVPEGARIVVTLDCDALDPSVMPGVLSSVPGGLSYTQVIDLIHGLGGRGTIAGFDIVELMPERDVRGISAFTAYRITANAITAIGIGLK